MRAPRMVKREGLGSKNAIWSEISLKHLLHSRGNETLETRNTSVRKSVALILELSYELEVRVWQGPSWQCG
jgi:hypothetical protein